MEYVRLNALDELFLHLDHREEPWVVHLEVRVAGRLDPDRLAAAVVAAADRHPIARARLASWCGSDCSLRWEIADRLDTPLTIVDCVDEREVAHPDCLLQRGAVHVIALDVGYGTLDYRLRTDSRVTVMERTNARALTPELLASADILGPEEAVAPNGSDASARNSSSPSRNRR